MASKPQPIELELPEHLDWTPSKMSTWRSTKAAGAKFTYQQLRILGERGLDPETVPSIVVRSAVTAREYWIPAGTPAPVYVINCPIVGERRGRPLVITPLGDIQSVSPAGEIRKPRYGR